MQGLVLNKSHSAGLCEHDGGLIPTARLLFVSNTHWWGRSKGETDRQTDQTPSSLII